MGYSRYQDERDKDERAKEQARAVVAAVDSGWRPGSPLPAPQSPQHWAPIQPPQPQWPAPRPSNALLWVILVVLVINLGLTLYVFGVVHQIVNAAQSVSNLFN